MTNESIWLIKTLKKSSLKNLFIKSFYQTPICKIWDDDDLKNAQHPVPRGYIGVSDWKDDSCVTYLMADDETHFIRLVEIDFPFNHAGQMAISLESLNNDEFNAFCQSVFTQLMLLVSKGYAIKLGMHGGTLIEPYSEIENLIDCDMAVA